MNKEEILKEYNGWVNWLNMQLGGNIDCDLEIDEEDFESTNELLELIEDKLYELSNIIDAMGIFNDKIENLLNNLDKVGKNNDRY